MLLDPGCETEMSSKELRKAQKEFTRIITSLWNPIQTQEWREQFIHLDSQLTRVIGVKNTTSPYINFVRVPLNEVIATSASAALSISRRDRLAVAAAIVWGMVQLCDTPWLDDSWTGKNDIALIMEESSSNGSPRRSVLYPVLSYKFKSSMTSYNKDEKRPLENFQSNKLRHKTFLSLGIVLIELGLGKPFEEIRFEVSQAGLEPSGLPLEDFAVANHVLDSEILDMEVGEHYAKAVRRCIHCRFSGAKPTLNFAHPGFRKQFYTDVVTPIQETLDSQLTSTSMQNMVKVKEKVYID